MSSVRSIEGVGMTLQRRLGAVGFRLRLAVGVAIAIACMPAVAAGQAQAAQEWSLHVAGADRVSPGAPVNYRIAPRNVGDTATDGTGRLDITLPSGLTGVSVESGRFFGQAPVTWTCSD